ncbi:polysaccharide deacetylase family protein [archaeon]|nr:polysaccharide deacetylase family protein [archaeon]
MKKQIIRISGAALILLLFLFYIFPNNPTNSEGGIVTLTFDDGLKSQYEVVFKEMQKYNYKGTLFLLAEWDGLFEGRELMTFEEAKEMQNSGWEIGSHTLDHLSLTTISDDKIIEELERSKEILEKEGFEIKTIAFPYGIYNEKVIEETKKYYSASRPMEEGFNSIENPNFYHLKSKWVLKKHSSQEICFWIKKANKEEVWLILTFHNIGEGKTPWDFSEQKFKEVIECINKEGIKVKTIKEVLENEKRN